MHLLGMIEWEEQDDSEVPERIETFINDVEELDTWLEPFDPSNHSHEEWK
jgi:hypothetical protein